MTQTIYKYRVRYSEGEQFKPPYDYFVCEHLTPEGEERVFPELGLTLANDPGWTNNYQVRHCQDCQDVIDADRERFGEPKPHTPKALPKTKRGDQVECDCGRIVAASSIRFHLKNGMAHSARRWNEYLGLPERDITDEQRDEMAERLLKTKLLTNDQLKIDYKALAEK